MSKSVMQADWDICYVCGRNRVADPCGLEEHHAFGGANRKLSEKYGLKVHICGVATEMEQTPCIGTGKRIWQSRQQPRRCLRANILMRSL